MTHSTQGRRVVAVGVGMTALVAVVSGAFAAGVLVGGPERRTPIGPPDPSSPPVRLVGAELVPPTSCEALLDDFVRRGIDLVGRYGWDGDIVYAQESFPGGDLVGAPTATDQAEAGTARATNEATGTNVQEAGVDEPDIVKTDGEHLYRLDDDELTAYDATGSTITPLGELDLDGIAAAEMLLVDDRLVIVGANLPERDDHTRVVVVDVEDPARPTVVDLRAYDAGLVTARLHDGVVRLVLSTGLPALDFVEPDGQRGDESARRQNEEVVRATSLDDWLPHVIEVGDDDTVDPATGTLVAECSQVVVPEDGDAALGTTTVVALDPSAEAGAEAPADPGATAVATEATTTYFSTDRLYLAATADQGWCCIDWLRDRVSGSGGPDGTTSLHAFSLEGTDTAYVASGEVDGALRDRWAMDSVDGVLRLAVGPTQATGPFNSVVTLREDGAELVEVGRLDGLGPNEEIRSVRWFDDLAVVVTFRQVDPLYAVDLTDVEEPRLLGELKIPGYSEYLHPLGADRMIGIGQDADLTGMVRGAQAALFDVTDLTAPRRLDTVEYPRMSQAGAATDPRQFTWLPDRRTALTVVSKGWRGRTGWVSVLRLGDGAMQGELLPVEYGDEIDEVRLVPLPSGKVVLVTGDDVSFLAL